MRWLLVFAAWLIVAAFIWALLRTASKGDDRVKRLREEREERQAFTFRNGRG